MSTDISIPPPADSAAFRVLADEACPRWIKEIHTFMGVKSQFLLFGNIRDQFPFPLGAAFPGTYNLPRIHTYLTDFLYGLGFEAVLLADPINGMTVLTPSVLPKEKYAQGKADYQKKAMEVINRLIKEADIPAELRIDKVTGKLTTTVEKGNLPIAVRIADVLLRQAPLKAGEEPAKADPRYDFPMAILFDYMMGHTGKGDSSATEPFIRSLILSHEAKVHRKLGVYCPVIWLCDRENEMPPWFSHNNPHVRTISVAKPDPSVRRRICASLVSGDDDFAKLPDDAARKAVLDAYVSQTDGLTVGDIAAIAEFRSANRLRIEQIADAARRYKLGITDDPWRKILEGKKPGQFVAEKEVLLRSRVKGQAPAVRKASTILRKAVRGVSAAQSGSATNKPKGVLFLAGPSGTGKTELAKALTEAVFGDEKSYVRFDMAEFGAEHADQRLMGAPPGYVGFEAGGELTQAIRQKPCCVVLFDEIEKAHKKLWDKFLAILDDGQITSGQGERVYFSETIVVFTSNLGMKSVLEKIAAAGGTIPSYEDLCKALNEEIDLFFTKELGRPELRGRLGDNVVIFDFIREAVAGEILRKQIDLILSRHKEQAGYAFEVGGTIGEAGTAMNQLASLCFTNLPRTGGRGIGERLDTVLNSPLTAWIDANEGKIEPSPTRKFMIKRVTEPLPGQFELEIE